MKMLFQRHPAMLSTFIVYLILVIIPVWLMIDYIIAAGRGSMDLFAPVYVVRYISIAFVLALPLIMIGTIEGIKQRNRFYGFVALASYNAGLRRLSLLYYVVPDLEY